MQTTRLAFASASESAEAKDSSAGSAILIPEAFRKRRRDVDSEVIGHPKVREGGLLVYRNQTQFAIPELKHQWDSTDQAAVISNTVICTPK